MHIPWPRIPVSEHSGWLRLHCNIHSVTTQYRRYNHHGIFAFTFLSSP